MSGPQSELFHRQAAVHRHNLLSEGAGRERGLAIPLNMELGEGGDLREFLLKFTFSIMGKTKWNCGTPSPPYGRLGDVNSFV